MHTILKRLNQSGELRFMPRAPGKHQLYLNRPVTPVALGSDIVAFMRDNMHEHEAMRATDVHGDAERTAKPQVKRKRRRPTT